MPAVLATIAKPTIRLLTMCMWALHVQVVDGACSDPSYAIALAAADGVHKPAQVQQAVLSAFASLGSSLTQQHVQQLQEVLQSCCGGALPRSTDQLHKLQATAAEDGCQQLQQQQVRRSGVPELAAVTCCKIAYATQAVCSCSKCQK